MVDFIRSSARGVILKRRQPALVAEDAERRGRERMDARWG